MAEVIPTHTHAVVDADRPFVIDPDTMEVTSRDANLKLPQHSKNAEVFTFTLSSSVVEGYDLATCNSVKVHYENVDSKTGKISAGLYTVSDFSATENGVNLSWVVDDDATRYVGALIFSIHFSCFDEDGALVYNLPTLTYSKITVGATVWLSDTIEREYPDIVTEFERRLSVMEKAPAVLCSPQVLPPEKKAQARFNIKACDAGIITGTSDTLTWDGNRDGVFSYQIYSKVSDVVPSIGIEDFANGCSKKGFRKGYGVEEEFYDSSDVIVDSRGIIVISPVANNNSYGLGVAAIVPHDYYAEDGTIELEKGVYFVDMRVVGIEIYGVSLTIPGYTGFGRQQLDPALLPDSVATKEYVAEAIAESGGAISQDDLQKIAEKAAELVDVPEPDLSGLVKSVNGFAPDENGNVAVEVGGGLTTAQINALDGMFRIAAYTADASAKYATFRAAFGLDGSGGDVPDVPADPEVELVSVSATYSGGDVTIGTDVNDLSGIVVTATYSDGSTATVTDYTISGTIAEGENTVTVTYQGKTATFVVAGVAETEEAPDYTWLYTADNGVPLSERSDIVTYSQNVTGGTVIENMSNSGYLHLVAESTTRDGSPHMKYSFVDAHCNEGKLSARVKFNAVASGGYSSKPPIGGSGFRLQLSNGTSGGQLFQNIETDDTCYWGIYEGTKFKHIGTFEIGKWYKIEVELSNNSYSIYVNDELLYTTSALSTNYCTSNAVFNAVSNWTNIFPNGYKSDVEVAWIAYKKVS